jgi:hypothetical protein
MERLNPETGKPWKYGEIGPDGRIFLAYRRKSRINKDGTFQMNWLTPEAWAKREISCREAAKRSQKRNAKIIKDENKDEFVKLLTPFLCNNSHAITYFFKLMNGSKLPEIIPNGSLCKILVQNLDYNANKRALLESELEIS